MARPPRCRDTGAHTPPGSAATVLWQCVPPRVYHRPLPLQPHLLLQVTERHPIPDLEVNQIIPPPVLPHPVAARRAGWEATGSAPESEGGRAQAARRLQAAPTSCCWRPGLCRQPTSSPSLVSQLQHKRGVLRQGARLLARMAAHGSLCTSAHALHALGALQWAPRHHRPPRRPSQSLFCSTSRHRARCRQPCSPPETPRGAAPSFPAHRAGSGRWRCGRKP